MGLRAVVADGQDILLRVDPDRYLDVEELKRRFPGRDIGKTRQLPPAVRAAISGGEHTTQPLRGNQRGCFGESQSVPVPDISVSGGWQLQICSWLIALFLRPENAAAVPSSGLYWVRYLFSIDLCLVFFLFYEKYALGEDRTLFSIPVRLFSLLILNPA